MSLKIRFTLLYTAVFGITLVVFGFIVYFTMYRTMTAELDKNISAMAASVVRSMRISGSPFLPQQVILPDVDVFSSPGTYLQVIDPGGHAVVRTRNLGLQSLPMSEDTLNKASGGKEFYETVRYGEQKIRIYSYPLAINGQLAGVLQVGRSLVDLEAVLSRLRLMIAFGGLLSVLAAAFLGFTLARAAFRPMERITEAAASIERGSDLKKRINYQGPRDEMFRLAQTLDGMLERLSGLYRRLEEANETQRRFVADVSHELRTPLTTIRGNADLLLKMGDEDPGTRSEAIQDIADEAGRLTRLVSNLLYLARADAGQQVETVPVPLDDMLALVLSGAKFVAGRNIDVTGFGDQTSLTVKVNTDLIVQAINILIENADKYTPLQGRVGICVRTGNESRSEKRFSWLEIMPPQVRPGFVAIDVCDNGPGIPDNQREEVFKRFFRGSAGRGKSGSGLGLSIAGWIVERHGGEIGMVSEEGKGSIFTITLPLCTVEETLKTLSLKP